MFKSNALADHVALAQDVLRGGAETGLAFNRICAAGPGMADKVDTGDGTIDQALVLDGDLLALVQGNWPVVAALYFDTDGTPLS
jgi:hypothetical protein